MQQNAVSPFFLDALKPFFYVACRKVNGGCLSFVRLRRATSSISRTTSKQTR